MVKIDDLIMEQFLAAGDSQYLGPKMDNFKSKSTYIVNKLWLRNLVKIAYNAALDEASKGDYNYINKLRKELK